MKNISAFEMSSSIHDKTIIVCKEETRKGKTGVNVIIKACYNNTNLNEDIELCSLEDKRSVISCNALAELQELAKTSPRKYVEKLITEQFGTLPVLGENHGTSYLLPNRFQRFYEECIKIYGEAYEVYFTDLAIKYFADFIKSLSEKRKIESLKYAEKMIVSGKAQHLKLNISKGFNFSRINECVFDKNEDGYVRCLDPKNVLYYYTSQDKDGNLDQVDIDNMVEILTMFAKRNGGFRHIEWDHEDAVAHSYKGGSVLLTGHDINKEAFEKMHVLLKKM